MGIEWYPSKEKASQDCVDAVAAGDEDESSTDSGFERGDDRVRDLPGLPAERCNWVTMKRLRFFMTYPNDASDRQFVLETMQADLRALRNPLGYESAMRFQKAFAMPSHLTGRDRTAATTSRQRRPRHQTAPPPSGSSLPPLQRQRHVLADHSKEVRPSMLSFGIKCQTTAENSHLPLRR